MTYMKKIFALVCFLPLFAFAQNPGFTIQLKVSGLADKSKVSVSDVNKPEDTVARGVVMNGSVMLKGSVQEPNLYYVNFDDAKKRMVVFLSNENIQVTGDANDLQKLTVKGSRSHDDFRLFQDTFNPLFQRLSEITKEAQSGQSGNDSLMNIYNEQLVKIRSSIDAFIDKNKSSAVSPFLLLVTNEIVGDPEKVQTQLRSLDEKVQKGFYGKILQEQLDKANKGAIGSDAIAFTQNDTTGNPVSLTSFKGKYVLLDFWASWCKPCRIENPNVVAAFNKFKNKNFTVLGISLDRSREPWIRAINDDNLTWTHVSDLKFWSNEVAVQYGIESIPQNYLIDPNGKIIAKNLRGEELQSRLCELLGCE
jgi:peroxiredoxin